MSNEFRIEWIALKKVDKETIVDCMVKEFKIPKEKAYTLKRIFDLAKPGVIMGKNDQGAYCRLSEDSREVVNVLLREYM